MKYILFGFFILSNLYCEDSGDEKKIICEKWILSSYMLHGRPHAKKDKNLLCPSIQNNCCTKMD